MREIIAAAVALIVGVSISYVGYLFSKKAVSKGGNGISLMSFVRQAINIAYFVAVYFISAKLGINIIYPLIAAALGITVPMFYFTYRLIKNMEKKNPEQKGEE